MFRPSEQLHLPGFDLVDGALDGSGVLPLGQTGGDGSDVTAQSDGEPATGTASTCSCNQAEQLTAATTPSGSGSYTYDGSGLRTSKTVTGVTIRYTWGAASCLLSDGTKSYIYGPDGSPLEQTSSAGALYFVHDQVGSTRALLNSAGAVAGSHAYTPYGVATHTGTASTILRYTGQYLDSETGLTYLRGFYTTDSSTGPGRATRCTALPGKLANGWARRPASTDGRQAVCAAKVRRQIATKPRRRAGFQGCCG